MVAAQLTFCTHQGDQVFLILFCFQQRRTQLHVQQIAAAGLGVIHGADGFDNGGGAVLIIAGVRGYAVCQRRTGFAAGRQRAGDFAVGNVGDDGHVAGDKTVTQQVFIRGSDFVGEVHHLLGDIVHVGIVIAVLGSVVDQNLAFYLIAFEISFEHFDQLIHGEDLVFVNQLFHGGHGIDQVGQARGFQAGAVVKPGSAEQAVRAVFHAALRQDGTDGFGQLLHMGLLRYMNAGHGHFDLIGHLFFDRVFKFFIGIESSGIAGFQADVALPVAGVAVEQCPFHSDGVAVAAAFGPHVGRTGGIRFDAAAHGPVIGVFQRHAAALQNTEGIFIVKHGGLTGAQPDQVANLHQIFVGCLFVDADVDGGGVHPQIHGALEHHGRQRVDGVLSIVVHAAHCDAAERNVTGVIGRAIGSHHINVLGQFDPQTLQQLLSFQLGNGAVFHVGFVEGIEILVGPGDAAGLLVFIGPDHHLGKPHGLDGFVEVPGCFVRGAAGFGNLQQFCSAGRVGLCCRQLPGIVGMALAHHAAGFTADDDGFIKFGLAPSLGVSAIQGGQIGLGLLAHALEAFFHHNVVIAHRPFAAAGGGFGVAENNVGAHADVFEFVAHIGIEIFLHGFAFPEGENYFPQSLFGFFGDLIGVLGTGSHGVHFVFNPLVADFGADDGGAVLGAFGADDQFVVADHQGLFRHVGQQRLGMADRKIFCFGFLVYTGVHQRTKDIQLGFISEKLVSQAVDAIGRTIGPFFSFHIVVAAASHNCASFIMILMGTNFSGWLRCCDWGYGEMLFNRRSGRASRTIPETF